MTIYAATDVRVAGTSGGETFTVALLAIRLLAFTAGELFLG